MIAAAGQAGKNHPQPKKVLVVDDHPPSSKVESALLRELGYECETAGDGLKALELLAGNRYDLILLDLQMPGIDGLETAQRIRALEKTTGRTATPIVGMTGRATADDRLFCLKAGMNDYLSKPFRLEELEGKLNLLFANV